MNKIFNFSISAREKVIFVAFSLIFAISRLYNLSILPIFTDEAIYIRWTEIIWSVRSLENAGTLLFYPLTDGKQPLYMWLSGIPMIFIK
ncbi:MAG: hypothetical protein M3P33_02430, partial [bacterium]|nr:hypothetical protein [bacterium]